MRAFVRILRDAATQFAEDRCTTLAAAIAYYALFSLAPLLYVLLIVLTTAFSFAYDEDDASSRAEQLLNENAAQLVGNEAAADEIGQIIDQTQATSGKWWKSLLSLAGIAIGATGVVAAIQDSLNLVWRVGPDPERGTLTTFAAKRLLSLAMILGLGFLLLVSMAVSTVVAAAGERFAGWTGFGAGLASWANFTALFVATVLLFAAIFKFMPDAVISWRDVWVGAIVTACLFTAGRLGLDHYFARAEPGARLGAAAASLVAILIWIYYSSLILLVGAEFTRAFADASGEGVRPEAGAVRVLRVVERVPPSG